MLNSIRKRQRSLLLIITIIIIVAFAWFYSPASRTQEGGPGGPIGKLNGRTITLSQVRSIAKNFHLAGALGMTDMLQQLVTDGSTQDLQTFSFAWNLLLLRDEANRLQIIPTPKQIKKAEKTLPQFQTNGKFDVTKYQQFVDLIKSNGYRVTDIDDIVLDHLRFVGISHLVKESAPAPESMFRQQYKLGYQKMALGVIRFKRANFESSVQISDDEIKKYYDEHKNAFQSREKRQISLASFLLTEAQKKSPEDQQLIAKKALAEQSNTFAEAILQNPNIFDEVAKSKGIQLQQTGFFTATEPDKLIAQEPTLSHQAFILNKENPVSDVIEGAAGFYVMKLTETEPSRPLSLEEAKDQVITTLKNEKSEAALQTKAKEVREKISTDFKNSINFLKAAEAAGYKAETPDAFALADPGSNIDLATTLRINRTNLNVGQLSPILNDQNGGLLVYVIKKEPIDESKYKEFKKANFALFNEQFKDIAFHEWLKVQLKKSGQSTIFGSGATG